MDAGDCPMCATLGLGDNEYTVAVADLPYTSVGLERRSLLAGYCVVIWRQGHVVEPTDLSPDQAAGYWRDVTVVGRAVREQFGPMKMNYLTLGNYVQHLHTHVLPRYPDDPAPGAFIQWEAIFKPEPTPESTLQSQAAELRDRLT